MTKTPWLDLEMPAHGYRGGNFVAKLLDDFKDDPRGAHARTAGSRSTSTTRVPYDQDPVPWCPRTHRASAPNVND